MALSAADLQKKHDAEGAPDPFPALPEEPAQSRSKQVKQELELDTDSRQAFPSLASSAPVAKPAIQSAWGASNGPRIKPVINKQPVFADSFTIATAELANKDTKPVGDGVKQVTAKYKVKVEASGNQRQTTFHMKAESQRELDKAKRLLLALLSPTETFSVTAPVSTISTIIGPKGATLKQIRDTTNVKIDIPPKDSLNGATNGTNGHTAGDDEDEEPSVQITVTGPKPSAMEAVDLLKQIIASKTSKSTQRIRDIPAHVLPFVLVRKSVYEAAAKGGDLKLQSSGREITASGEREAVTSVLDLIKTDIAGLSSGLTSLKISLPKRQHRLLFGKGAQDIMAKSKCAVVVSNFDDPSDEVTVWGQAADLPAGLGAVMEQANSKYIHEFPLPGPVALSKQLLEYMNRIGYTKTLSEKHAGVSIFTPSPAVIERAHSLVIDIVGDKPAVDAVVRQVSELIGKLIGATKEVSIDWLIHRVVNGKNAKKIKQFHDTYNVSVYFPSESAEQSSVLLVYDPLSKAASPSPDDKAKSLDEVTKELLKMAKDAADVKSETLQVEKRWHDAVIGQGGTTLNAIIGEDKTLSIKFGLEAGESTTEDTILIRGISTDVSRASKEILKIVENAKNDEIVNSFSTDFEISSEYVGRIVGAQGSGVNKLRDQLGVKVDVSDDFDDKESSGKKKKSVHHKSKITITGRKENVEEAQKRILAQVERLADETSEILKIPSQYHSGLIGQNGKYVIRLEEKYSVKITFPRQTAENGEGKTREQLKLDEVLVKGGKKGVAAAKSELLDAVEFEKETNNVLKFTVPTRSVARILGKGGASINEIKDTTEAQIDVEKVSDDQTNITVRGTKKAINAAKAAIVAISDQVAEEITVSVTVENKYHRTLIGAGGQGLKDLVSRCGGDPDPRLLASLIRFPRQGDPSNEVRLRGEPSIVKKLKVELEKAISALRDRVILAVEIPSSSHRALIGRGGQHLNELQERTGAQVQFPGSRSYAQVGEAENGSEMSGVDPANIVKVTGSRSACEKAVEALQVSIDMNMTELASPELITTTVSVPLKYHHAISQQGQFFRNLRNFGVQVDQSVQAQKPVVPSKPASSNGEATARIDEEEDSTVPEIEWEVAPNYQDGEEGDSVWTLKARDQEGLDRAQKLIQEAIGHAERMSFVGFLTLPDRSAFPRIVGSKGANVMRLRSETGADITVSRENSTIVITGIYINLFITNFRTYFVSRFGT
ncbi:hypothetical protein BDP27DRAFT_1212369 [Rhodocollybia butyracea]|uniref:K Homology domain-containing protein n=1 Tax=Rhodocollybia butyracea TaxID=206335 RepID=A0A9P5UDQ5_9AGAR|nr:hypothetical protein BDP27DRAFT_1212369 [Rhodocollybia butyracea]